PDRRRRQGLERRGSRCRGGQRGAAGCRPFPRPALQRLVDEFESLVADAIDRLPDEFQAELEKVPVVVSDLGTQERAYGQYPGDGAARDLYMDRIVIYRDTLERDFGHDRDLLARQVEQTLRHELAHHLGWDERGVGGLGL